MDIKIVKNSENGIFSTVNRTTLAQLVDSNFELQNMQGKRLFLLNITTNERTELCPEIKKYEFCRIVYSSNDRDYIFFTSLETISENRSKMNVYRYSLTDNLTVLSMTKEIDNSLISDDYSMCLFVMDSNFFFFEVFDKNQNVEEIFLRDIVNDNNIDITESTIGEMGIYKLIPANGNNCVIKLGKVQNIARMKESEEMIALVNPKQLVSELNFNMNELTLDVLETSGAESTFPYIKIIGNKLIFSKYTRDIRTEEIFIYDLETKIKQVRLNSNVEKAMDLSFTYVINDIPYLLKKENHNTFLINLNTQKEEVKFSSDRVIHFLIDDMIIMTHYRHGIPIIKPETTYIEVIRFPETHHPIVSQRADFSGCMVCGDNLVIFTT